MTLLRWLSVNYTCSEAAKQGSILWIPLLRFTCFSIHTHLWSRTTEQHMPLLTLGRSSREERVRHWSCKRWLDGNWQRLLLCGMGSASSLWSTCEEAQKQVQICCKTEGFLQGQALIKQLKGGAIYCRSGVPASELNCSDYLSCDCRVWFPLTPQFTAPISYIVSRWQLTGEGPGLLQPHNS